MFENPWNSSHYERGCQSAARRGRGWGRGGGPFGGGRRPGPPEWLGDFFGQPPRAERGGVRYLILDAISSQARHGYEIIQAIEERSGGAYRPSPGVIYPTLQLLEELGHARVLEQDGRKVYAITPEGTTELGSHRDEVSEFYNRSAEDGWERHVEDFGDLIRRAARLLKTFNRASRRGHLSAKAQSSIRDVLNDAVQRIEEILESGER